MRRYNPLPFTARRHRASAEGRYLFGSLPNFLYAARVAAMAGRLLTDSNGQLFLIVSFSFSMSSHSESGVGGFSTAASIASTLSPGAAFLIFSENLI